MLVGGLCLSERLLITKRRGVLARRHGMIEFIQREWERIDEWMVRAAIEGGEGQEGNTRTREPRLKAHETRLELRLCGVLAHTAGSHDKQDLAVCCIGVAACMLFYQWAHCTYGVWGDGVTICTGVAVVWRTCCVDAV